MALASTAYYRDFKLLNGRWFLYTRTSELKIVLQIIPNTIFSPPLLVWFKLKFTTCESH